jgi:hypothetical protein
MPSGGHARSGPPPDPNSLKSAKRGLIFSALPAEGHQGEAPEFPLPGITYHETSLWTWAWKTPQAEAWAAEPWRWPSVALWVRTFVKCSSEDGRAADINSLHRLADQIGMTPAGLKENGWKIAEATPSRTAATGTDGPAPAPRKSARARLLNAVPDAE